MKAVLFSIKPEYCELIANGKKTIEVRKNKPKLDTPFKVYIYCTQGDALAYPCLNNSKFAIHRTNNGTLNGRQMTVKERVKSDHFFANGKVIGEFVCDSIDCYTNYSLDEQKGHVKRRIELLRSACMTLRDWRDYIGSYISDFGYAWHISELAIYDKPKELSEFIKPCPTPFQCDKCNDLVEHFGCGRTLLRPPQTWCYVESEVQEDEL